MAASLLGSLIVVLVLVLRVTIPFEINVGFYPDESYKVWLYVMDAIFWLDMPVNMFGAFYEGTELVTDPHEIMEHYLWGNPFTENKGWFWIDLTGNIPWEYIFINSLGSGQESRRNCSSCLSCRSCCVSANS